MYSDMSRRTMSLPEPNRKAASDRASSVLPTPVGPRNRSTPSGPRRRCSPACATNSEDAPVAGHQPVALAVRGGGHPDDRLVEDKGAGGTDEAGVTEGEDATVAGHQPVALR